MANKSRTDTPSNCWSVGLIALSVLVGFSSLYFAFCGNRLAALIAAILSIFWSTLAAGLLAFRSSARRMRARVHERIVDSARDYLVQELKAERDSGAKGVPSKAELVDRLHGMAMKALDESDRHP